MVDLPYETELSGYSFEDLDTRLMVGRDLLAVSYFKRLIKKSTDRGIDNVFIEEMKDPRYEVRLPLDEDHFFAIDVKKLYDIGESIEEIGMKTYSTNDERLDIEAEKSALTIRLFSNKIYSDDVKVFKYRKPTDWN